MAEKNKPSNNNNKKEKVVINIIKKKKSDGEEAHSHGAWKVAYADFMTAMMAFFLLMWLINIVSDDQKAGLATYFSPIGMEAVIEQKISKEDHDTSPGWDILNLQKATYENVSETLNSALENDQDLKDLKDNIIVEKTKEGILINITSKDNKDIFQNGMSTLTEIGTKLIKNIALLLRDIPNKIKIFGHTDASPIWSKTGFSNWELSSNRANTIRRLLSGYGIPEASFVAVVGNADKHLLNEDDPLDPINKRASILILDDQESTKIENSVSISQTK